jgi:hypothetical protein
MIDPFVDSIACGMGLVVGLALGAAAMAWYAVATSGEGSIRTDRDVLLKVLTVDLAIRPELAARIIESSGSVWSALRYKMRPWLWKLQRDWPEYEGNLKSEYEAMTAQDLPENSSGPSEEPFPTIDAADLDLL